MGYSVMDSALIAQFSIWASLIFGYISFCQRSDEKLFNYLLLSWGFLILNFALLSQINHMISSFIFLMAFMLAKDNYRNVYMLFSSILLIVAMFHYDYGSVSNMEKTIAISIIITLMFLFRGLYLRLSLIASYSFLLFFSLLNEVIAISIAHSISLICLITSTYLIKKSKSI